MRNQCALAALLLLWGIRAGAQLSGRISGSVVDMSGSAVPGATVNLYLAGGAKPLTTTRTSADGLYHFIGLRAADYDLSVESAGFVTNTVHRISVDAARETDVPEIKLRLASVTSNVEVTANVEGVDIDNAEISDTVTMEEIHNLPIIDRDPLGILQTQPGVIANGNSYTVINGLRTSFSDMTLDGINIQDNYIRDNALDFTPNKLLISQVRQVTMVNANGNAASSGGATETAFSTPSGTNQLHGELYWLNRNNAFSANNFFNNMAGVPLPFLNQNQFGPSIGGPIKKDKLFFYGTYEGTRVHSQTTQDATILTAPAREGIFRYKDAAGVLHQVNLLALTGLTQIDPVMQKLLEQVPGPQFINNNLVGDGLNTSGYEFNQRDNEIRDNVTGRIDYNINSTQAVYGSFSWNRDNLDRPDLENDYSLIPKVTNPTNAKFLALSWRTTPTPRLTNEVRAGFNLTYGYFLTSQNFGGYLLTGETFSDPVNEFMPQGRNTNTYVLSDDAGYQRGHHFIQFGFHGQHVYVRSYSDAGVVPTYNLAMGLGQPALQTRQLPGIDTNDLANANALLATLGGYIDSYGQTFNVTSPTSGYVPGAAYLRHFTMPNYAVYAQDKWKVTSRLSVTIGLRYELPGVVDERDSLEVAPVIQGNATNTLQSNATLNFAGSSANNSWYHHTYKEFAPNLGAAWDVFGDGKTALRGAYSIYYVNDQSILAPEDALETNAGLQGVSSAEGLSNRVSTGLPTIPVPAYNVPLTEAQLYATNPFNVIGMIDPNLHRPYVQQYSIGIQHEYRNTVFEARYVGNHMVGGYRAFDFNQVNINVDGFLQDFQRAENNGNLAAARNGGNFNPNYNPGIPGSQPLTVFPKLNGGGELNNADVRNLIQTGQVGELGYFYQTNGLTNANISFFANPYAVNTEYLTNYSSSSYNSLQLVARHRMRSGLSIEANYTFAKVLSDADGDVQSRFQNFLDINNPGLERSRANFDLTHMIKANGFYELPLGKGHAAHFRPLDRVIGGWVYGAVMTWQSGAPFSILSGYGTLNIASAAVGSAAYGYSYYNTADTTLSGQALFNAVQFRMTGNGPMIVPQSALNTDGTGANGAGQAPYAGQIFYNPGAGTVGTLQRRLFDGPWTFDIDMNLAKNIKIVEGKTLELRMDAYNALNHSTFWSGDQNINSNTFGVISSTFFNPRVMEFGLYFKF
jgi:hypothetical protein